MNITNLYNLFRKYKFSGDEVDKYVIEAVLLEALQTYEVSEWDIEILNNKILNYMVSKNERDYKKYLNYLLKSKTIEPLQLNIENIRKFVEKELIEVKGLINEIEQRKIKQ